MARDDRSKLTNVGTTAPRATRRAALAIAAIAGLALPVNRALAANGTWSGTAGDGLWVTPGNWDTVPGVNDGTFISTDVATFNNLAGATSTITVDTNRNVAGITFDTANADAYTFTGAALHLTGGGTTQITAAVSSGAETFNNNLAIEGASYTLTNLSTNFTYFTIGGNVATNVGSGSASLTLTGANNAFLSFGQLAGANTITGVIDKGTATSTSLNITGSAWVLSNANTYGGNTTVDGANTYLAVDNNGALSTGALVMQNGAHLQAFSAPVTMANDLQIANGMAVVDGVNSVALTGNTTFTGGSTLRNNLASSQTLSLGSVFLSNSLATPRTITFDGNGVTVINGSLADSNGAGGTVNLVKSGGVSSSLTILSASPTYTGAVTVNAGALILGSDTATGTSAITLAGGSLQGTGTGLRTIANNLILTGNSVVSGAQDITITGSVTNSGGNRTLGAQSLTNAVTFAGPIFLSETSGTGRTLTIDGGSNSSVQPYSITGVISNFNGAGGAAGNLIKAGWGNLTLAANNTYTGTTTVNFDTLTIGSGGATGSVVGAISVISGAHLRFNRSGGTYTIANPITGAGDVGTSGPASSVYTTSTAYTYTGGFVLGNGNTFLLATDSTPTSGTVTSGPFGTGTFSVATSPLSNSTGQILQPTLANRTIANTINLLNNLTIQGSFNLSLTGTITTTGSISLVNNLDAGKTLTLGASGKTLTLNGINSVHTFDGSGNTQVLSNISQGGSNPQTLAKTGAGVLTLNGTSSFMANTTVSQGAIVYNTAASLQTATGGRVVQTQQSITAVRGAVGYAGSASGLVDTAFLNTIAVGSSGAFAVLAGDAARNLDFTSLPLSNFPNMAIGSAGDITYSGTITPAGSNYMLGGGSGTLTVSSVLADGASARNVLIFAGGGPVVLSGSSTYTGFTGTAGVGILSISSIANGGVASPIGASTSDPSNLRITAGGTFRYTGVSAVTDRGFDPSVNSFMEVTNAATTLEFDGAVTGGGFTKIGAGTLTLGGAASTGNVNVNAGALTVSAAGSLVNGTITVASGATFNATGALATTAVVNDNGATNFAGNTTSVTQTRQIGTLNIGNGATAKVTASAFPFTPEVLNAAVTFGNGASQLNLTNNELITPATLPIIVGFIQDHMIVTTSTGGGLGTLDLGNGNIEVRFTLLGDTNLDGTVDVTDLGNLASNFGAASGAKWVQGDTNYDGAVDVTDLGNLSSNFGGHLASGPSAGESAMTATSLATVAGSGSTTAVPEPAVGFALGLSALGLITRGRRRRARID